MVSLDNIPASARAEAVQSIRALIGTPEEVPVALQAAADMITIWRAAPQEAVDMVAALYREARGAA